MTTAIVAPDSESEHSDSQDRPTLDGALADTPRQDSPAHSFDPTQGRQIGSNPYDDPTQGRQIGSNPYDDPTQGRQIGSNPYDDPTRARQTAARGEQSGRGASGRTG